MTNFTHLTFDTEATGLQTAVDQIIEISLQLSTENREEVRFLTWRVQPTREISAGAYQVHGIRMEDLAEAPSFQEIGAEIREYFEAATTIIGYNVTFDLQILQAEFQRHGFSPLSLAGKCIVDPLQIWRALRPRTLRDAYKKFCGKELVDAHSAEADVRATDEVFQAMRTHFELEDATPAELMALSLPADWIGISNQIRWQQGEPHFSFGKGKGKPVWEYLQKEPHYYQWMKKANFLPHVLEICEKATTEKKADFLGWVRENYPQHSAR
ncbi:3'-5' exonuclease [bacterium]|nr:3'-5' exonuclease [bacterium]